MQRHFARGTARLHHASRHHQANHLAHVLHRVYGKHRLVTRKSGQHGVAGTVGAQDHAHHGGHGQRGTRVHAAQMAVGLGGQDGRGVQGAAQLGHVINIGGGARHLCDRAFMRDGAAAGGGVRWHPWCAGAGRWFWCGELGAPCGLGGRGVFHCSAPSMSSSSSACRSVRGVPWLSSQKRQSRLPSTSLR